jgi:hypothetical protein
MEDTYKGESPSKKFARFMYWAGIASLVGSKKFLKGRHLVLASREGGDIAMLRGMDVPARNIIAVEINPTAAMEVQDKYPDVKIVCGDVEQIAKEYKRSLSSAFLDFCSPVSQPLLQKVCQVIRHSLMDGAVLGCAFLNGREREEETKSGISQTRMKSWIYSTNPDTITDEDLVFYYLSEFRDFIVPYKSLNDKKGMASKWRNLSDDDFAFAVIERFPEATEGLAQEIRFLLKDAQGSNPTAISRAHYVAARLIECGPQYKSAPIPLAFMSYMSNTKKAKGIPMFIYMGRIVRAMPGATATKFKRTFRKIMSRAPLPRIVNCDMNEDQIRDFVLGYIDHLDEKGLPTDHAHLLFNIPKGTLTAFKAHRSRGTY